MKFTSQLIAAASGSIGGATFSRNRGGQYIRRRAIPSNPNSEAQGLARTNLATAVASWTNTLDDAQRQAWSTYAAATPVIDPIGQSVVLSGQQMYVRSATVCLIAGLAIPTAAPVDSGLGLTPDFVSDPTIDAGDQLITVEYSIADPLVTNTFVTYMSRPVMASRTAAHETRRFAGTTTGLATNPTGDDVPTPFVVTAGQRVRVTVLNIDAQRRISSISFRDVIVVD